MERGEPSARGRMRSRPQKSRTSPRIERANRIKRQGKISPHTLVAVIAEPGSERFLEQEAAVLRKIGPGPTSSRWG